MHQHWQDPWHRPQPRAWDFQWPRQLTQAWQRVAIWLVVLLFPGFHIASDWDGFYQWLSVKSEVHDSDLVSGRCALQELNRVFEEAMTAINHVDQDPDAYSPYQLALDRAALLEAGWVAERAFRKNFYSDKIGVLINRYIRDRFDPTVPGHTQIRADLKWQFQHAMNKVGPNGEGVDWSKVWTRLKAMANWLYLNFLPWALLILVVKRWPERKYRLEFGDSVCLLISLLLWPMGVFAYKPKNKYQERIEHELKRYKTRFGDSTWSLAKAIVYTCVIVLWSSFKPQLVRGGQQSLDVAPIVQTDFRNQEAPADNESLRPKFAAIVVNILQQVLTAIRQLTSKASTVLMPPMVPNWSRTIIYLHGPPIRAVTLLVIRFIHFKAPPHGVFATSV